MNNNQSFLNFYIPTINPITVKNTVSRTTISASEQEQFIINVINRAVLDGTIDVGGGVSDLDLDTVESSSASIQNGNFSTISAINDLITFDAVLRLENSIFAGPVSSVFDSTGTFNIQNFGSILNTGSLTELRTDQTIIKNNVVGIGVNNTGTDNFINGIYFPKKDNFSSQGSVILDRSAIVSLPFGQFLNDSTYAAITNQTNRFEGARTSIRFVYLDQEFTFTGRSTDTEFSVGQQDYINSLNNISNAASIYYTNIESHNITLHGGKIISGIGKNLEIYLTNSSNIESKFLTFNLATDNVSFDKNIELVIADFKFENLGSISFTSQNILNAILGPSNLIFFRPIQIQSNSSFQVTGSELDFRDSLSNSFMKFSKLPTNTSDNAIEKVLFNYYNGDFLVQGRFADVQLQIDDYVKINGPYYNSGVTKSSTNNDDNPTLELKNKENYSSLTNLSSSRTYLQNKTLLASSSVTFNFANICQNSQTDFIFSGFAIISSTDSTNNSYLHLRLDGSYNNLDTTEPTILTKTVIKRNVLTLDSSIAFTESVDYSNSNGPVLSLLINNSTTTNFIVALKIEVIAI